jgi:hypothetical protein
MSRRRWGPSIGLAVPELMSMLAFRLGGRVEAAVRDPTDTASGVASLLFNIANIFEEDDTRVTDADSRLSPRLENTLVGPNCRPEPELRSILPNFDRSPALVWGGRVTGVVHPSAPT